jgi:tRNA (mo5U34)-methyltransferase
VIGFEPVAKHWYTFNLLNRYAACGNLRFEPLGLDHLRFFSGHFDIVFCMGILYHHTDPMQVLRLIHQALKPGGQLVIDCQGIAGRDPVALTPRQRYAGAKGIWFLPTLPCLENWVARANFRSLDAFYDAPLSQEEQRATPWSPGQSLGDFIDPQDPLQTIEGYPAPRRFYVSARK